MTNKRKYDDGCATAHALDLVGERWSLLIARELIFGPKRFTDLRIGMPGTSPNVLSQRLRELEDVGILRKRKLPPPAAVWVYELTEWGQQLEPVIITLGQWGGRSPLMRHDAPLSVNALMLALKSLFDPLAAGEFATKLEMRLDEDRFRVQIADGRIEISQGELMDPDTVITTDPPTLNALIWGERELNDALKRGELAMLGDRASFQRFLDLFPLPKLAALV